MRGTVNTFFRGSIPLGAYNIIIYNKIIKRRDNKKII
jgi:hypothetical protein